MEIKDLRAYLDRIIWVASHLVQKATLWTLRRVVEDSIELVASAMVQTFIDEIIAMSPGAPPGLFSFAVPR